MTLKLSDPKSGLCDNGFVWEKNEKIKLRKNDNTVPRNGLGGDLELAGTSRSPPQSHRGSQGCRELSIKENKV